MKAFWKKCTKDYLVFSSCEKGAFLNFSENCPILLGCGTCYYFWKELTFLICKVCARTLWRRESPTLCRGRRCFCLWPSQRAPGLPQKWSRLCPIPWTALARRPPVDPAPGRAESRVFSGSGQGPPGFAVGSAICWCPGIGSKVWLLLQFDAINLQYMMNAKLSQHEFWPWHENGLIKTI